MSDNLAMAPLGALSQAWTAAEAWLLHGCQLSGLSGCDEPWVAPAR